MTTSTPAPPEIAPVVVDPRFRQRRIAVRRDEGLRRLQRLLVLVVVAAIALATVIVLRSPILDVDEIAVSGAARLDVGTVQEAAGIETGAALALADLGAAETRIEALPWVETAEVRRSWPGTVDVRIRERRAAAVLVHGGDLLLVDPSGRVLGPTVPPEIADWPTPLVQVVAPDAPPAPGDWIDDTLLDAVAVADRLDDEAAGLVLAVRAEPALHLQLADGATATLGDAEDLGEKMAAFRTIAARVDLACLGHVDLTVPTHPVVTRRPACP